MKKLFKIGLIAILGIGLTLTSCKKKGCIDEVAKNYDTEAQKDDGSCEYYTNTELLTMGTWKYASVDAEVDSLESGYDEFLDGMTMTFRTNGSYDIVIPSDSDAGVEDGTWEFNSDESVITLDKGQQDEQDIAIEVLTIDNLDTKFTDGANNEKVTIKMVH